MSTNSVPKGNKNSAKFALLAGMLAFGLLASGLIGSQMSSAQAQNSDDPMPVDIGCPTGAEVCEDNDNATSAASNDATVATSGTATTKVQPDKFSVTVGVETNGTTAAEAASLNANLTGKIIAALEELGIQENQISTSSYSISPVYEQIAPTEPCIKIYPPPPECQPKQNIVGYVASSSLTVTLDTNGDVDAGEVIDTSIEAGANTVNGVFFFVSQEMQEQVRDSLIQDAIANARHRADIAANAVGLEVSGVKSISLNDVAFPVFARGVEAQTTASDIGTPVLPGEQEVTMTVSVVYDMGAATAETGNGGEDTSASENAVAIARQFVLSKLPSLGIQIDNELDLHSDMVVEITESEFHVEIGIMDTNGQSHEGHIEITNGEVTVAVLDGQSIL
jgi:uncharacterized protein YggE